MADDESQFLSFNFAMLKFFGIWNVNLKNYPTLNKIHSAYGAFFIVYFCSFVASEYVEIIGGVNESFFSMLNNLSVSLLYSISILKIKIGKSDQIRKFVGYIKQTEDYIFSSEDENLKEIYMNHMKWNHNLSKWFSLLALTTILPFFVNPIIIEKSGDVTEFIQIIDNKTVYLERALPFSAWFPFNKNKYYSLAYGMHILAGTFGCFFTCAMDIVLWSFMIFGINQMNVLQYKLKNLKVDGYNQPDTKNISLEDRVTNNLRSCVYLHQEIIGYIFDLNNSLSFLMLLDFCICSMQIAVIGFQVIVTEFGISQVFAIEYLLCMLIQMFLFYWHANEITLASLDISQAVWESNFHEFPIEIQKSLIFLMFRSQVPLTLTVGPFYAMSTGTALSIVRAAYSYVALMRQVY